MDSPFRQKENPESSKKDLWSFGLNSIKAEMILYDLCQSLYWQSIIEAGIMLSAFIALFTSHSMLFFMHLTHILRPYIAFKILYKLPRTHLILEEISDELIKAHNEAIQFVQEKFKSSSAFYSHYLILSAVSAFFDFIALIYNLSETGGTTNTYIFYVNIAWIFLGFDIYVLLWSKSLLFTLPKAFRDASNDIAQTTLRDTNLIVNNMIHQFVNKPK
ncbi:hypothetical protein SteCoe_36059 [Stentor coeruleus]|uniref:Uncharacterized protein n=1 Tax=Stentor coeruleus TaxID=5963 RepID=A0A1R2AQW3_9CILI|nr:hypothetical protein SteCoe_36059 [Stentor coeruleus]